MKKLFARLGLIVLLVPLWIFLRAAYRDRIGAFGCFDDCFNYMGGYFLLEGKRLFSEIFFNHMPGMAYISTAIQYVTKPESIYMLLYEHRMFMIYASIAADAALILRFGVAGFAFALLYETTKGFLFGERFLAEGLIVYPVVYLFGIAWGSLSGKKVPAWELVSSAVLTWFIVFMREPYVPLAIALFAVLLWQTKQSRVRGISIAVFLLLSVVTVMLHDVKEFWFNVVVVNLQSVAKTEASANAAGGWGIAHIFFYPITVFFGGSWNLFRYIEAAISAVLLMLAGITFISKKQGKHLVYFAFFILALANVRTIMPGSLYYGTFHHLVWYALAIAVAVLFVRDSWAHRATRPFAIGSMVFFAGLVAWNWFSGDSYLAERVDRQTEITTNYAQYYATGETVRRLSGTGDTLFLDEWDDLIYWQAKRVAPYQYAWYTSVMPQFEKYRQAREAMFDATPPTFYYGKCASDGVSSSLPPAYANDYVRLTAGGKPSCLWILKDKYLQISDAQWASVSEFQYGKHPVVVEK